MNALVLILRMMLESKESGMPVWRHPRSLVGMSWLFLLTADSHALNSFGSGNEQQWQRDNCAGDEQRRDSDVQLE
jgi:hypothetical protein